MDCVGLLMLTNGQVTSIGEKSIKDMDFNAVRTLMSQQADTFAVSLGCTGAAQRTHR